MKMSYEWDPQKAKDNISKHGVYFSDAVIIFEDEFAISIEDDNEDEQRFIRIGIDAFQRVLVVVYTWRDLEIRIISARRANATERKQYEDKR